MSLFDAAVDLFYKKVLADDKVNYFFEDKTRLFKAATKNAGTEQQGSAEVTTHE